MNNDGTSIEIVLPKTAEAWWELAQKIPKVAGPWEEHCTEEQRVKVLRVRRDIRAYEKIVIVYGPHFHPMDINAAKRERRWWIAAFLGELNWMGCAQKSHEEGCSAFHETMEQAQQAADRKLTEYGWLLVEGKQP